MSDYPPMIMRYPDDLTFWKRIKLPWTKPPLSMNDAAPASRGAVYGRAAKKREIQELLHLLGRGLSMPEGKRYLLVQMNYRVPDKRRRDTDNVTASSKPLMDALSAGSKRIPGLSLVDDDTPYFMGKPEPILWPPVRGERGAMWVDLWVAAGPSFPYGA